MWNKYDGYIPAKTGKVNITNVSFHYSYPYSTTLTINITDANFDNLDPSYLVGCVLIPQTTLSGRYFKVYFSSATEYTVESWYGGGTHSYEKWQFSVNNDTIILQNDANLCEELIGLYDQGSFASQMTIYVAALVGELIGFVVAPSLLYPEDGLQGKYYYTLLASADSANTLSLTDAATTTIKNIAIEEVQQEVTI